MTQPLEKNLAVPGIYVLARRFGIRGLVQNLYRSTTMASEDYNESGTVDSGEMCLVLGVHKNLIYVLTQQGCLGWKHVDDFTRIDGTKLFEHVWDERSLKRAIDPGIDCEECKAVVPFDMTFQCSNCMMCICYVCSSHEGQCSIGCPQSHSFSNDHENGVEIDPPS